MTAVDYVPALLDKARQRAIAEGLEVRFEVADGEDLPFDDGRFDVVLSTFGAMFTPDQPTKPQTTTVLASSAGSGAPGRSTPRW